MNLPKQVTHTLLFLIVATALLAFLWLSPNSDNEKSVDLTSANKTELTQKHYYQITELLPEGFLILHNVAEKHQINHPKFETLTLEKSKDLQDFFVGRFIELDTPLESNEKLALPLRLFHPVCFNPQSSTDEGRNQCPLVLNP